MCSMIFPIYVEKKTSPFVKTIDAFFFAIVFVSPLAAMWIDKDTGDGRFLTWALLIFSVFSVCAYKSFYIKWNWALMLYLLSWGWGLLVDLFSGNYGNQVEIWINARQMFVSFLFMLVAYNMSLRDSRNIKRFLWLIVISSIITAIFICIGVGTFESTERGIDGIRYKVFGQNENGTSRVFAVTLLLLFLIGISSIVEKKSVRIASIIAIPVVIIGMFRCASRGGIVFLIATIPFVIFTTRNIAKKFKCIVLVSIAICGIILAVMNSGMLYERLVKTFYDRDTGSREFIFHACLDMFKKSPICGYGLNNHRIVLGSYQSIPYRATHCAYTYPLVAMGLVGAIPYFIFMVSLIIVACKIRYCQYGNYIFLAIIYSFLSGISGNLEYARWMFLIFGVALAAEKHNRLSIYYRHSIMR